MKGEARLFSQKTTEKGVRERARKVLITRRVASRVNRDVSAFSRSARVGLARATGRGTLILYTVAMHTRDTCYRGQG